MFFLDIFHHITPCLHCMWSVCMFTLRKTSARLLNAARLFSGILAPSENRRIFLEVWLQIWLRIRRCVFFFDILNLFTPCLHCTLSVWMFSLRKTSARFLNVTRLFSGVWFRDPSPKRKQTQFFGGMAADFREDK